MKYATHKSQILACQSSGPFGTFWLLGVKRPTLVIILIVKPTILSRFSMTDIGQFSIKADVYLDHFLSDIFGNLDVDNEMSISCGGDEPQI